MDNPSYAGHRMKGVDPQSKTYRCVDCGVTLTGCTARDVRTLEQDGFCYLSNGLDSVSPIR